MSDRYAQAGVDYRLLDPGKRLAQQLAASTADVLAARGVTEVAGSRGESAYVVDLGDAYLTTVTEGLGTKNLVADAVRAITGRTHYDAIAKDTVATILNDLATMGGAPLSLTAFWATGDSDWWKDAERARDLVTGWADACREAGVSWGGGETQAIGGLVVPGTIVLGGSANGLVRPKGRLLSGARIAAGDVVLVAPSTGIHANGLTLARRTAASLPQGLATPVPGDGRSFGEALLDPSPLYGPLVEALQEAGVDLHYVVHVTGHGWRKLMRADAAWTYVIDRLPAVPPVLAMLADAAGMDAKEAYGTFNMGAGYALMLPRADAARAVDAARKAGFTLLEAGRVEAGAKRVVVEPLGVEWAGEDLAIR